MGSSSSDAYYTTFFVVVLEWNLSPNDSKKLRFYFDFSRRPNCKARLKADRSLTNLYSLFLIVWNFVSNLVPSARWSFSNSCTKSLNLFMILIRISLVLEIPI